MPLLVLQDKSKQDLAYLSEVSPAVLNEFCKIAIEFLRRGANPKLFAGAARKLGVPTENVQHSVQGLSYLLLESSRQNLSETDFLDSILLLAFPSEINMALKDMFLAHKREIRVLLAELSFDLPHYDNVHWRLDMQMATRCLRSNPTPVFTIQIETLEPKPKTTTVQADYVNLKRMCAEIELALKEIKGAHARRIMRNVRGDNGDERKWWWAG